MRPEDEIQLLKNAIKSAKAKLHEVEMWLNTVHDGDYEDDEYGMCLDAETMANNLDTIQHDLQTALIDTTF